MQCTLLVPHLFWPRDSADAVRRDLELPALKKILARSRAHSSVAPTAETWLCQAFEVEQQQDWPVAPLTLALDGIDPEERYWLRADPAHMKVERDRLLFVDAELFDVSDDDAHAFVKTLNDHFAGELAFIAPAPKRWYVSAPKPPDLATRNPEEVAGRDVQAYLPSGSDAVKWHRVFNETQMLLHEHPRNAEREARGEPIINTVWFWGGGTRARVYGRHFAGVWSDDALAAALAAAADIPAYPQPPDAHAWLSAVAGTAGGASHLVTLGSLANATRYGDIDAWRTRAAALDAEWLAPLAAALADGRVSRLVLAVPGAARSWHFEMTRTDLLKFWRGSKPLSEYA